MYNHSLLILSTFLYILSRALTSLQKWRLMISTVGVSRANVNFVIICHMSVTMALTNQIVDGWTLRDSAISHVLLNFGPELASPALNQLIRAMWDCKSPPKGGYLQSHMAESFCRFFELKSFLFEFYFFELYLFESSIGSMMINTISPGSRGSLAASRPATAALGPAALGAAVACRDLAIPPRLPGEIVYFLPDNGCTLHHLACFT